MTSSGAFSVGCHFYSVHLSDPTVFAFYSYVENKYSLGLPRFNYLLFYQLVWWETSVKTWNKDSLNI